VPAMNKSALPNTGTAYQSKLLVKLWLWDMACYWFHICPVIRESCIQICDTDVLHSSSSII